MFRVLRMFALFAVARMWVAPDPTTATTKWVTNLGQATPSITAGVNAVTQAPGVKAAQARATYLAKVQANVDKWARNVAAVSLADWQQSMINVGIPRIAQGAQAKQGKYLAFAQSFYPFVENIAAKVRAMPKVTLQDGINRAIAQIQGNATYKKPAGA